MYHIQLLICYRVTERHVTKSYNGTFRTGPSRILPHDCVAIGPFITCLNICTVPLKTCIQSAVLKNQRSTVLYIQYYPEYAMNNFFKNVLYREESKKTYVREIFLNTFFSSDGCFTVLHNDLAVSQGHCGGCWIRTQDLCHLSLQGALTINYTTSPNLPISRRSTTAPCLNIVHLP